MAQIAQISGEAADGTDYSDFGRSLVSDIGDEDDDLRAGRASAFAGFVAIDLTLCASSFVIGAWTISVHTQPDHSESV